MARLWANAILKVNRALLKKRKVRKLKDLLTENSGKTKTNFKQVSPAELEKIKSKIRERAKGHVFKEVKLYLYSLIVLIFLIWVVIQVF